MLSSAPLLGQGQYLGTPLFSWSASFGPPPAGQDFLQPGSSPAGRHNQVGPTLPLAGTRLAEPRSPSAGVSQAPSTVQPHPWRGDRSRRDCPWPGLQVGTPQCPQGRASTSLGPRPALQSRSSLLPGWIGLGGADLAGLFVHDVTCRSWDAPGSDWYVLQSVLSSGGG
jgi:hypothetical protein